MIEAAFVEGGVVHHSGANKRKIDWTDGHLPPKISRVRNGTEWHSEMEMTAEDLAMEQNATKAKAAGVEGMGLETPPGDSDGIAGAPNEPALRGLMQRTGYSLVQENGQRKYGGPPPGWNNRPPPRGSEVFVGKIPRDVFEDELVPVFETVGRLYELRLMMDFDRKNRGYAFVMYTCKADAKEAVRKLNNYEIRKGRLLGVCSSVDNCRLFVGGIPKTKKKDEIFSEMTKVTEGVTDVIVYPSASDKTKNRGFAFVEYDSHRAAAMARRKLIPGRIQLWGHPIAVDWAEPEQKVDQDIMDQVKVLYVRNLMLDTTEDTIQKTFSQYHPGTVERVKKIRDYAFVHFTNREACMDAMTKLNATQIDGTEIEVTLAKPVDKNDYNRLAKVGAKVLAQGPGGVETSPPAASTIVQPGVISQNGMVVYPAALPGVYPPDMAYYPLGQYNLTPNTRGIYPTRGGASRGGRGRGGAGRSSYLGYSAGKATYGRYYAKNNPSDRVVDINGNTVELILPGQMAVPASPTQPRLTLYNPGTVQTQQQHTAAVAAAYAAFAGQIPQTVGAIPPQQTLVSPAVSAPAPLTQSVAVLEDLCQKQMLGTPIYQLLTTVGPDSRQLYVYKVSIPALASLYPHQPFFQPNKLCTTVEEAKSFAAEYVLSQLVIQPDPAASVVPLATVMPQNGAYQGVYAAAPLPGVRASQSSPSSIANGTAAGYPATFVPVSTPSPTGPVTMPMSILDPTTMQPITVMYQ